MQSNEWYYTLGGTSRGPVSEDKMRELILSKQLTEDGTLVWCNQMSDWQSLSEINMFQPTLENVAFQEQEEKKRQAAKRSYIRPIRREYEDPSKYLTRIYLWGALRSTLASLPLLSLWSWIYLPSNNISIFLLAIPLGIAAGLCSGIYYPERNSIPFKAMAGAIAALAFLFARLIKYTIDQGAVTGENLISSLLSTLSVEGVIAACSNFTNVDTFGILTSFLVAFIFSIHGMDILHGLSRYRDIYD